MAKIINISKRKRTAYANGVRVYLQDEAHAIGHGWRVLSVLKEGRKWVRVAEVATGRTARIDIDTWRQLKEESMP